MSAATGALSSAPYVDGVRAMRAGSTLKPFLYALAIERRLLTPASLLETRRWSCPTARALRAADYDREFRGLVSMRVALASSLNVPAVRTLGMVGVEAFTGQLRTLGFDRNRRAAGDYYGAALALGSADVRLWDLVNAYRTLANGGRYSRDAPCTRRRAGARAANLLAGDRLSISDILADRATPRGHVRPGERAGDALLECRQNRHQQGHARQLVRRLHRPLHGRRLGRQFRRRPMHDVTGVTGAAPVWRDVMDYLDQRFGRGAIAKPAGVTARMVDVPQRGRTRARGMVPRGHRAESPGGASQRHAANSLAGAGHRIAFDPDIPIDRQHVAFVASAGGGRLALDARSQTLGPATA